MPNVVVAPLKMSVPPEVKAMIADARRCVDTVDMSALKHVLETADDALIVDVREPFEYAQGHVPGAVNIPRGLLEFAIWDKLTRPGKADAQRHVYCYCLKAGRAIRAAKSLQEVGVENVFAVDMQLEAWQRRGYPLE
jgi:rhodanese-related sulfurtransferase